MIKVSKKLYIIGAGGFGKEVKWLVERINKISHIWDIAGYIDDNFEKGTMINGVPVIGNIDYLNSIREPINVVCAIGSSITRRTTIEKITSLHIEFPNLLDPSVIISDSVVLGKGVIICAGSILTVNIKINDFVIINLDCTIGHDAKLDSYVTLYPSVNVSGKVSIGEATEIGTGTHIIQGKSVLNETIIGAGAVVVRDIPARCTALGSPAKPIKFHDYL